MLLHTLLRQFSTDIPVRGLKNVLVRAVREDSRQVQPGDLFVARSGAKADGRQFIADAHAKGAVAVITNDPLSASPLPQICVHDPAGAASVLANLLYDNPSQKVNVFGITGTNGKTTTTYLIRHILASVKKRCGMIGTVEIDDGRTRREATMTTPSAVETAELLANMRDRGCWSCAMEVSSHALDQSRVVGVRFAGAAFTNLTGDHLDYHQTMEKYAAAKAKLFESLDSSAVAVVNANDSWSHRMVQNCKARVIEFGIGRKGDYRAKDVTVTAEGSAFTLVTPDGEADVKMRLIGKHNVANVLTAAALVGEVYHMPIRQIAAALTDAPGAPGRLQPVRCGQPFAVLVDYAHTDDALENVLAALRPMTQGKLRVLFGCGGDRDRTKRPRMARTAEKLADVVYLTSDNPRTEDPQGIIEEIISGLSAEVDLTGMPRNGRGPARRSIGGGERKPVIVEADRHLAIRRIIGDAMPGDVVLLAGKGHENYQIIGTEKRHFDDVEEATRALHGQATAAA
jgi:UDP-N-acetylmuramoyl-L-alanyl-D-glutamate--2,6-diaminopimelate ligase